MHYWNKDYFESLKYIGEKYIKVEGFELLGEYYLLREKGLKKKATASIKEFVEKIAKKPINDQREIAIELSTLLYEDSNAHGDYILLEYLRGIMKDWISSESDNPIPYKWQGFLSGDVSYFKDALKLIPKDEMCLFYVARSYLDQVDFMAHHLSESIFLGEITRAQDLITCAKELIERLPTGNLRTQMEDGCTHFKKLIDCWDEYSSCERSISFSDWCSSKGYKFNLGSIIYYNK